jgi:hypothetical protein
MVRKKSKKEDLGLAEEHIKLAEGLIEDTARDLEGEDAEALTDVAFSLEKAEAELEEIDE